MQNKKNDLCERIISDASEHLNSELREVFKYFMEY